MTVTDVAPDFSALLARAAAEASGWDAGTGLPRDVIGEAAKAGLLGLDVPTTYGGGGVSARAVGQVAAELGAVCSSLRALLTVSGMVNAAVHRWGTAAQRQSWLPRLASGDVLAGFAATEPGAGTELAAVATRIEPRDGEVRVSGHKVWVTFGQDADVLLVLGRAPGGLTTVLVPADAPGVRREPVTDALGLRGARLAHIGFDDVRVPADHVIGPPGFGLTHTVGTALDHGRHTVAWGCVGMAEGCLAEAAGHVARRRQGNTPLSGHATVRAALGRAHVRAEGARSLCERAAALRESKDRQAITATIMAKYAAATAAAAVSRDTVQLLGAAGCTTNGRAGRFFRDAKIMQIIEGADEVAELAIGDRVISQYAPHVRDGQR
ncbi:acyl-CoA dehydrogenase family protein [Streptomyces aureoverticillatus]|uniref:acyl-CoA dehydrogenase family protein n=1 Tax=Streptomyces aureoverticillatus TaxID=66871 RepID=UPI001EF786C1|nr:acyl-CoA dehydrogenase family protein [Streptomyces aureoverticillatus]